MEQAKGIKEVIHQINFKKQNNHNDNNTLDGSRLLTCLSPVNIANGNCPRLSLEISLLPKWAPSQYPQITGKK